MQAADAAGEVRKALKIARPLKLRAIHDGREAHRLGVRFAMPRDQRRKPLHDVFIERSAAIDPGEPISWNSTSARGSSGAAGGEAGSGGAASMATFISNPLPSRKKTN